MVDIKIDIDVHGPLFDGRAEHAAKDFTRDLRAELARGGKEILVQEMRLAFKHPRPHYWTTVTTHVVSEYVEKVTDDGSVVYNYWLAGQGSRNFPRTRFGGYRHWPKAIARTRARIDPLAAQMLPRYLDRMM